MKTKKMKYITKKEFLEELFKLRVKVVEKHNKVIFVNKYIRGTQLYATKAEAVAQWRENKRCFEMGII